MQTQIATELSRDDLTTPIQTAIQAAIKHYSRKLMVFGQETTTIATVASTSSYALPSDFLAFERVELNDGNDITRLTEYGYNDLATMDVDQATGFPSKYAYRDYQIRLYPIPDAVYTVTVYYWRMVGPPVDGADSTVWTNDALDLIRHRAKWDVASNTIRDDQAAQTYRVHEDDTLGGIIIQRDRLFSQGMLIPTQF